MNCSKYFSILSAYFLALTLAAQAQGQWLRVESPTTKSLRKVISVDSLYWWAAGDSGIIIRSTNGGKNWTPQQSGVQSEINDIYFLDRQRGWALTWKTIGSVLQGSILETSNEGRDWVKRDYPEPNVHLRTICFLDSLTGFVGAETGQFLKTIDGGLEWRPVTVDSLTFSSFPLVSIQFFNKQTGYAVGGSIDIAGTVFYTTDGGDNWIGKLISPEPVNQLHIFDSTHAIGVGGDFEYGISMISTENRGVSWSYKTLDIWGFGSSISFRTRGEGWATVRDQRQLVVTRDTGATWTAIITPDTAEINGVFFADSLHGIGVGNNGAIIRYSTAPVGVREKKSMPALPIEVKANYPNPFNATTILRYVIHNAPSAGEESRVFVSLAVYDALGNKVAAILEEEQAPGIYEYPFDAGGIASGIYYYELRAAGYRVAGKMCLLR